MNKKRIVPLVILYILSIFIAGGLFFLSDASILLPIINRLLLYISVIIVFVVHIIVIYKFTRIEIKNTWKILTTLLLIILLFVYTYFSVIFAIFFSSPYGEFEYNNRIYYYMDKGFLVSSYFFYEKDSFITIDELDYNEIEYLYKHKSEITGKDADASKAALDGYIHVDGTDDFMD